jgi:hypothetical protein
MTARSQDFYAQVRKHNETIWNALNDLVALQREWTALDYGNTLPAGEGVHDGLTKTDLGSVVFDTATAFVGVLTAGHATNMAKIL